LGWTGASLRTSGALRALGLLGPSARLAFGVAAGGLASAREGPESMLHCWQPPVICFALRGREPASHSMCAWDATTAVESPNTTNEKITDTTNVGILYI